MPTSSPASPAPANPPAPAAKPHRRVVAGPVVDPEGAARAAAAKTAPIKDRPRDVYFQDAAGFWIKERAELLAAAFQQILAKGVKFNTPESDAYVARRDAFAEAQGEFQHLRDMASG